MSETKRSWSRQTNASPRGSHATTDASSLRSISMSLRGNGLAWPVEPGDDVADSAGEVVAEEEEVRVILRLGSIMLVPGTLIGADPFG